jgi:uncharacterized membrane protein
LLVIMLLYSVVKLSMPCNHNAVKLMKKDGKFGVSVKLTLATIFAALVFVVTSQIPPIPIPATGGYFNLGETTIYVAALLFGPFVGGFSGGIGAMLSDIYLGYVHFAPGTLIIKGVEGAIVGFLNIKLGKYVPNPTVRATISVVVGGLEMVAGYFLYENLLAILFPSLEIYAIAEVPLNIGQMLVGLIIAVPIMHAVLRVFPQLKSQI